MSKQLILCQVVMTKTLTVYDLCQGVITKTS